MAAWDFLGTMDSSGLGASDAISAVNSVQPNPIQSGIDNAYGSWLGNLTDGIMGKMGNMLGDPNTLATFGQFAQGLDQGMGIGGAAGTAGYNNVRRKAMQEAGGQMGQEQMTPIQQMIKAVVEGDPRKLVGPEDDENTANGLKIDKDGGMTFTAPAPKKKVPGEQTPLESIKNMGKDSYWYQSDRRGDSPF